MTLSETIAAGCIVVGLGWWVFRGYQAWRDRWVKEPEAYDYLIVFGLPLLGLFMLGMWG